MAPIETEVKRATKMFYIHRSMSLYTTHLARVVVSLHWIGRDMARDLHTVVALLPLSHSKRHRMFHELDRKVLQIYEGLMVEERWGTLRRCDFYDKYVSGRLEWSDIDEEPDS